MRAVRCAVLRFAGIVLHVPASVATPPPGLPPSRYTPEGCAITIHKEMRAHQGTVWHHLLTAYWHLVRVVGLGPSGLLRIRHADWNDEVLMHVPPRERVRMVLRGESVLVSAMAA